MLKAYVVLNHVRNISADKRPRTSSWLCNLMSGYGVRRLSGPGTTLTNRNLRIKRSDFLNVTVAQI